MAIMILTLKIIIDTNEENYFNHVYNTGSKISKTDLPIYN